MHSGCACSGGDGGKTLQDRIQVLEGGQKVYEKTLLNTSIKFSHIETKLTTGLQDVQRLCQEKEASDKAAHDLFKSRLEVLEAGDAFFCQNLWDFKVAQKLAMEGVLAAIDEIRKENASVKLHLQEYIISARRDAHQNGEKLGILEIGMQSMASGLETRFGSLKEQAFLKFQDRFVSFEREFHRHDEKFRLLEAETQRMKNEIEAQVVSTTTTVPSSPPTGLSVPRGGVPICLGFATKASKTQLWDKVVLPIFKGLGYPPTLKIAKQTAVDTWTKEGHIGEEEEEQQYSTSPDRRKRQRLQNQKMVDHSPGVLCVFFHFASTCRLDPVLRQTHLSAFLGRPALQEKATRTTNNNLTSVVVVVTRGHAGMKPMELTEATVAEHGVDKMVEIRVSQDWSICHEAAPTQNCFRVLRDVVRGMSKQ